MRAERAKVDDAGKRMTKLKELEKALSGGEKKLTSMEKKQEEKEKGKGKEEKEERSTWAPGRGPDHR